MVLSDKRLLSRGGKKSELNPLGFGFFELGIRSKTAQFLLTVESSCCFKEYSSLCDKGSHNCVQLAVLTLQLIPVSLGHRRNSWNTLGTSQHRGAGAAVLLPEAREALPVEPCLRVPPGAQLPSAPAFLKGNILWLAGIHPNPQHTVNLRGEGCASGRDPHAAAGTSCLPLVLKLSIPLLFNSCQSCVIQPGLAGICLPRSLTRLHLLHLQLCGRISFPGK